MAASLPDEPLALGGSTWPIGWNVGFLEQPFEEPERYDARRIREQFPRELLVRYLDALGIRVDEHDFYLDGVLFQETVDYETRELTLEQARLEYQP